MVHQVTKVHPEMMDCPESQVIRAIEDHRVEMGSQVHLVVLVHQVLEVHLAQMDVPVVQVHPDHQDHLDHLLNHLAMIQPP